MDKNTAHRERATDLGIVRINNEAIATIASIAAMEVRGVNKMGGGISRTLCDIFGRKASSKGVRIHMADNEAALTVSVIVEYGVDIPGIGDEVQENVKRVVENMTGLSLSGVDVVVEGVVRPQGARDK